MKKTIYLLTLLLTSLVVFLWGCNSKELSRSKAQSLIEAGNDYKQPFSVPLNQGDIVGFKEGLVAIEAAATAPLAEEVAAKQYLDLYPQIAVANHLGLVETRVKVKNPERRLNQLDGGAFWHLDEKYLPTDKAKQLWKQYDLPPTEDSVPLAGREIVEITGITKLGEDAAAAQFTWKFVPNEAGKAYDTTTAEFKALPVRLQQLLEGTLPEKQQFRTENKTMSFARTRQGEAAFRRYDDGWRLESVMFQ